MKSLFVVCFILILLHRSLGEVRGRVESCAGCKLNRLKDVKKFIYDDVPKYADITFKKIHGAPPELVILDEDDSEKERIPLEDKTREECNELLLNKGFQLKLSKGSSTKAEL